MSKALIIVDIQNDYFENGAMELAQPLQASGNAKLILTHFREKGLEVVHVQHLSLSPQATFFLPNTEGQEIHESVVPLPSEKLIVKNYPNSFRDTDLLSYLKSKEITELVFVGMMTHMCIDATVRAAKDYGFDCTVIADATATRTLEVNGKSVDAASIQTSFLAGLSFFYSKIITTGEYLK